MNKVRRIGIALFIIMLTVPSMIWGALGMISFGDHDFKASLEYDVGEKREKSEIADSVTDVSPSEMLENYYNDRIPFRSEIITINKKLTEMVERPYNQYIEKKYVAEAVEAARTQKDEKTAFEDEVTPTTDEILQNPLPAAEEAAAEDTQTSEVVEEEQVTETVELPDYAEENFSQEEETAKEQTDIPKVPLRVINDKVVIGAQGWLFFGEQRSINNYRCANLKSEEELASYADEFSRLNDACNAAGKQLICFVCPEKESIYPEYYPDVEQLGDINLATQVTDYITQNRGVQFIYPKKELCTYKDRYQLYYRHDTHWNAVGGYIGTAQIIRAAGLYAPSPDEIYTKPVTIESGDLILLSGMAGDEYKEDTNYDVGYMSHVGVFADKSFFDDVSSIDITSQSENDRYLVLVGDSCKMHMLQYLAVNFNHVTFVHSNALSTKTAVDAIGAADVIVLETAERKTAEFSSVAKNVSSLLE